MFISELLEVGSVVFLPRFGPTNNDFTFEKLWFGSDTNEGPSHLATNQISNIYKLHKQSSTCIQIITKPEMHTGPK